MFFLALNDAIIHFAVSDTHFRRFYEPFSGDTASLILYIGILENGLVGAAARGEAAWGRHFCFGESQGGVLGFRLTAELPLPYHPKRAAGYFSKADAGNRPPHHAELSNPFATLDAGGRQGLFGGNCRPLLG